VVLGRATQHTVAHSNLLHTGGANDASFAAIHAARFTTPPGFVPPLAFFATGSPADVAMAGERQRTMSGHGQSCLRPGCNSSSSTAAILESSETAAAAAADGALSLHCQVIAEVDCVFFG